jgi:hypothetical protein
MLAFKLQMPVITQKRAYMCVDKFLLTCPCMECNMLPPFPQSVHVHDFHICIFNHFHSLVHTVQEKSSGLKLSKSWTRSDIILLAIVTWVVCSFPMFVQMWNFFCPSFITFHTMYVLTKDTNMSASCDVNDELMFINYLRHLLKRLMLWTVQIITHIYLQPSTLRLDTILFRRPYILVWIPVLAYFLLLFACCIFTNTQSVQLHVFYLITCFRRETRMCKCRETLNDSNYDGSYVLCRFWSGTYEVWGCFIFIEQIVPQRVLPSQNSCSRCKILMFDSTLHCVWWCGSVIKWPSVDLRFAYEWRCMLCSELWQQVFWLGCQHFRETFYV